MVTQAELNMFAVAIERQIAMNKEVLDDLPDFSEGRRLRTNENVLDVQEIVS